MNASMVIEKMIVTTPLSELGWNGISFTIAAEIYGPNSNLWFGTSFGELSLSMWQSMIPYWSSDLCAGGFLDPMMGSKTSLAASQFIFLSARLFAMTQDTLYSSWFQLVFNWLQSAGLLRADYSVAYGLQINGTSCGQLQTAQYSDSPGLLISAMSYMYAVSLFSGYATQAQALVNATLNHFVVNNVIYEPLCDPNNASIPFVLCSDDDLAKKSALIRGYQDFYRFLGPLYPNTALLLRAVIMGTLDAYSTTCDAKFNCQNEWANVYNTAGSVTLQNPSALALLNSLFTFADAPSISNVTATTVSKSASRMTSTTSTKTMVIMNTAAPPMQFNNGATPNSPSLWMSLLCLVLLL